ncbi:hypothetical protein RIR_jg11588.t1 [Rhizophagus irregularis DAOM 181602=DAOM 197198]|nr:hypothetical protein RIR_jg11588.t1 [Rhizophagus irregularis DAOM 181602=DAOM 197198]
MKRHKWVSLMLVILKQQNNWSPLSKVVSDWQFMSMQNNTYWMSSSYLVIAFIDLTDSVLSGGKEKTRDKYDRNKNATLKPKSQLGSTYRTLNLRSVSMEGWN